MIKFFTKIRQNLLRENKTSRYFKYAIGEIILVVIGILIALQINNWNNNRQERQYEKQILVEIQKSLQNDFSLFQRLGDRNIVKDQAIDSLLLVRQNRLQLNDKTITKLIQKANWGLVFSYDKGAYEALKSSGVEKIKTDSLRNSLIRFYEVSLPRTKYFMDNIYVRYENEIIEKNKQLKDINLYEDYFKPNKDTTGFYKSRRYNVEQIHHPIYKEYLLLQANKKEDYRLRLYYIVEDIKKHLENINKELEVRFNIK
ncbi:DUF6090 family protein [Psychroserpens ponticola]|uniref:DUF6090 family protein n=1 Tax=Psychroserpens ponticola TaxID=2932268 RepID=A0ABY7RYI9_9FLAO|nr:DUF6090 family protein [Psychroserpens ponticola]WCO02216.1 DUF6090 family protein [Psychroserpens ponticola]